MVRLIFYTSAMNKIQFAYTGQRNSHNKIKDIKEVKLFSNLNCFRSI